MSVVAMSAVAAALAVVAEQGSRRFEVMTASGPAENLQSDVKKRWYLAI